MRGKPLGGVAGSDPTGSTVGAKSLRQEQTGGLEQAGGLEGRLGRGEREKGFAVGQR